MKIKLDKRLQVHYIVTMNGKNQTNQMQKGETSMETLKRAAVINLKKAAKRQDYFRAVWTRKNDNRPIKHKYQIIKRVGVYVYVQWVPYISGTRNAVPNSHKMTVGEFIKGYELSL